MYSSVSLVNRLTGHYRTNELLFSRLDIMPYSYVVMV